VPSVIPKLTTNLNELVSLDYRSLAYRIMSPYLPDYTEKELKEAISSAYDKKFDDENIAPLVKHANVWFLELYHGPTLAFKDMALSILPHLLKIAASKTGNNKEIIILTATSGDTGKAALEGFADVPGTKIIVFFPEDGVSQVQKRQMVTQPGENTYVIGIQGNFDDAQNGVKKMFADKELAQRMAAKNFMFSSANSINIGRMIPQVVYYFFAYLQLCVRGEAKVGEVVDFAIPTGNFGDILAGYYAKKMGLPIGKLICASNQNKVLYDFFLSGVYDKNREFYLSMSPSMDILISSNLERLLDQVSGDEHSLIRDLMLLLSTTGKYEITLQMKARLSDFIAGYASEEETVAAIKEVYEVSRYLIDPHTAVAFAAWRKYSKADINKTKTVVVSTASPYKFPRDVMKSLDESYATVGEFDLAEKMSILTGHPIPGAVKDLNKKPVLHKTVCAKNAMQGELEKILGL